MAEATAEAAANIRGTLGSPTISIGTIQGGSGTNIVPDRCETKWTGG